MQLIKVHTIILWLILALSIDANSSPDEEAQYHRRLRKVEASPTKPATSYGNPNPGEGPWPECVGKTGEWCMNYIAEWVAYAAHEASLNGATREMNIVNILDPYQFDPNRVWIHVDHQGAIQAPPSRG